MKIKINTTVNDNTNTFYHTTFFTTENLPKVGDEMFGGKVTAVTPIPFQTHLNRGNTKAMNYDYYSIETTDWEGEKMYENVAILKPEELWVY